MLSAADAVPIKKLLLTVFQSIAEVFLLCVAGYVLAYTGVTDKATQRKLNIINVSLFTPALLFSKVAFSLTPAKLMDMWIIPLSFVLITAVSAAVAWVMAKMFKLSRSQRAFAICAAMFQNSNSLPIALVQSLVIDVPVLKRDETDTKDQMLGRALAYLVVYSTLGMVLRWSWGVQLLASADEEELVKLDDEPNGNGHGNGHGHPTILGNGPNGNIITPEPQHLHAPAATGPGTFVLSPEPLHRSNPFDTPPRARSASTDHPRSNVYQPPDARSPSPSLPISTGVSAHSLHDTSLPLRGRRPTLRRASNSTRRSRSQSRADSGREFLGLPDVPHSHLLDVAEDSSESEAETEDEWGADLPLLRRRTSPPREGLQAAWHNVKTKLSSAWTKFNAFMTVPTWAALASIIIALIPRLQAWISDIKPFVQAVKSAGQCSIPVTLVVLGAFFYTPPSVALSTEEKPKTISEYIERKIRALKSGSDTENKYPGENRTVFVACVSRMVVVPLIFLPLIALLARYDPFTAARDPIFILCAVLLVSSPTALTLAQLTQAACGDAFERLISKTISISYAVLTPPLTLVYVVVGLWFARL